MKNVIRKLTLLSAALLLFAVPALAEIGASEEVNEQGANADKAVCILASNTCQGELDKVQQRIDTINREIERGTAVYSNEELKRLQGAGFGKGNYEEFASGWLISPVFTASSG